MKPIRADFALINGYLVDKFGNIMVQGHDPQLQHRHGHRPPTW